MFLYFIAEATVPAPTLRDAQELGIGYAFEGHIISHRVLANGPNEGAGQIWADGSTATGAIGYHPDRQEWRRISGDVWVGRNVSDYPPRPEDLRRRKQIAGVEEELGDGNCWLCPIARRWSFDNGDSAWYWTLPRGADFVDGKWRPTEVLRDYAELWDITRRWWDILSASDHDDRVEFDEESAWCVKALQINYRVSDTEVAMLRLLNDLTRGKILGSLVHWQDFVARMDEEERKKKRSQVITSSSPPGPADETPTIAQPCPI